MKFVRMNGHIPVKVWTENIEEGALDQARNLANLPFAFKHIALMPDAHEGYGMPIGGVLATESVVVPNAVGVDIGCGVVAVRTDIEAGAVTGQLELILQALQYLIPTGASGHKTEQEHPLFREVPEKDEAFIPDLPSAKRQLGTLGGGNHFLEIQQDHEDRVWIMLHSGSRGLGYKVAKHYDKLAQELNQQWFSRVPKEWDLAFLPVSHEAGAAYLRAMRFCMAYAEVNRKRMLERFLDVLSVQFPRSSVEVVSHIHHNYVDLENHYGRNVYVHRKGAVRARTGEVVAIPGSMGTASYIAEGLGSAESFDSCSHGAGRAMGRKEAERRFTAEDLATQMAGIVLLTDTGALDEIPSAYKDVDKVMLDQTELVVPTHHLRPLGVMKG